MKSKDIAVIIGVAFVTGIFSFVLSGYLFGGDDKENLKAPVVQPIVADFPNPDSRYFNAQSLNPTKVITIGESANQEPF